MPERNALEGSAVAAEYVIGQEGEHRRHPEPLLGSLIERTERVAYICDIISGDPGKGHVGAYIDSLKGEFDVVVCANIISEVMYGILARRGFQPEVHYAGEPFNEHVQALVWRAR